MKNLRILSVMMLGLVLVVGSSGCHKKVKGVTPIYDDKGNLINPDQGNINPGSGTPVPSQPDTGSTGVSSNPTGISEGTGKIDALLAGPHNEDREKFKADTVYFAFDQATIQSSEQSKLQDVASYFKGNTTDGLIVEGNCDERGTEKYNLSLGERRALSVREYLANLGVDPSRVKTVTYGASRPAIEGHNEAAWGKNRRGDFVLITPKK